MAIFDDLLKNSEFQEHLKKLPEDERKVILESLRKLTEQWETYLIKPLQNLKS